MGMTFYYARGTISLASLIALEETGLAYDTHRIDFGAKEQQSADYLAVNPKGRVPALVTEQGILTETHALLTYIASLAPDAALMPRDPWQAAQAHAIMAYLGSTVHVAHAHRMRGHRWADDPAAHKAMQAKVPANMAECFGFIQDNLLAGPWMLGDAYSVCDAYLFTIARWLDADGVNTADFPAITDHQGRMGDRPAVQAACKIAA